MQAVYYRAPDRSEPVSDFIDQQLVKHQVAIDNHIERINDLTPADPHLPFPHSSQVEGELRELRVRCGRTRYRILYRRSRNLVILLHACIKDTEKLDPADIAIAKRRWQDFRNRMGAQPRRRPRAAGHDAP